MKRPGYKNFTPKNHFFSFPLLTKISYCLICTIFFISNHISANIVYVDISATGANNGSSWTDAYSDLQDGLDNASCGDTLWVSAGIYKPDASGTDQNVRFTPACNFTILGGFSGVETSHEMRDWNGNLTVLSGDLNGSGLADAGDSHTIFYNDQTGTYIDGFTIRYGYADDAGLDNLAGAGILATHNIEIVNCEIHSNHAVGTGTGGVGGGVYGAFAILTVTNCYIHSNYASHSGGGLSPNGYVGASSSIITNCTFYGNDAAISGGATHVFNANANFKNCIFTENTGTNPDINKAGPGITWIEYSLFYPNGQPASTTDLGNNIYNSDPLLNYEDASLGSISPALDAGLNSANTELYDFNKNSRIIDANGNGYTVIDIGATESLPVDYKDIVAIGNLGINTNEPLVNLHVQGTFLLADGSQGEGKVLTSAANGKASWEPITDVPFTAVDQELPGAMRWTGDDFQGYINDSIQWVSLTNPQPYILGETGIVDNASFEWEGFTGWEAAHEMCRDIYNFGDRVIALTADEMWRAVVAENYDTANLDEIEDIEVWTMSASIDVGSGGGTSMHKNIAHGMLSGNNTTDKAITAIIRIDKVPNNDSSNSLTGDYVEVFNSESVNQALPVMCGYYK